MSKIFVASVLIALPCLAAENRRPLFDGKDTQGWEMIRPQGKDTFTVENGLLRTTGEKGDIVYTREKIGNAVVRVVYKMSNPKGNSGVFIRIPDIPKDESFMINRGIEVQIDNNDNDWHCTGVLYSMTKAKARPYKPAGEWNTMEITLDGPRTLYCVVATSRAVSFQEESDIISKHDTTVGWRSRDIASRAGTGPVACHFETSI